MGTPPPIEFASLGLWDSLILMGLALVTLGPRRLPEIARQIGKLMYEVRKASNDFKFQMEEELRRAEDDDLKKNDFAEMPALADPAQMMATTEAVFPPESVLEETVPRILPPAKPSISKLDSAEPVAAQLSTETTPQQEPPRHG